MQIQNLNSKLERIESQNTKARDGPRDYKCHVGYKACNRDDYESSCVYDWRTSKKEEIMRKNRITYPKFDGYSDPRVFSD